MKGNCEIKKGVFVQRPCNRTTTIKCNDCGLQVCELHCHTHESKTLCFACYAKIAKLNKDNLQDDFLYHDQHYSLWYWTMRDDYYSKYKDYKPFDQKDYASFDSMTEDNIDYIDSEDDFFDS